MNSKVLTAVTAVLALVVLAVIVFFAAKPAPLTVAANGYENQPRLGRTDAPVKLILFENFLCEHCRAFEEEVFGQLERDYIDTGLVEVFYVNLAWGDDTRTQQAALAAECAYHQNEEAFWDYKKALFAAQDDWQTIDDLMALAASVGTLDTDDLRTCTQAARYQSEVTRDIELGDYVGIESTPSLALGSIGLQGPSYETLKSAIEQQLNQQPE